VHFEDHPLDLDYLCYDKPLRLTRIQSHLKHVPKYLVPHIAPVSTTLKDGSLIKGSTTTGGGMMVQKVSASCPSVNLVPRREGAATGGVATEQRAQAVEEDVKRTP